MYRFQVNGTQHEVQEDQRLIDFLRADLKLTGTKEGCSAGACGTCTVIIDGKKAKACVSKLSQLDGKSVVTIEGLSEREKYTPMLLVNAEQCSVVSVSQV